MDLFTNKHKLADYVLKLEQDMNEWMRKCGWSKDALFAANESNYLSCPYDKQHDRISAKNYDKHVYKCKLKASAHTTQDIVGFKLIVIALKVFLDVFFVVLFRLSILSSPM